MTLAELCSEFADESKIPNPDGPRADLPRIQLPGGGFTITESAEKLFKLVAPTHKLFVLDGIVMKLRKSEKEISVLSELDPDAARSDFEKFGQLEVWVVSKQGIKVLKPALCSTGTAKALLYSAEAKELLPNVNGLINCPVIYECDGELKVAGPGYDAHTKRIVTGGKMPEEVDFSTALDALLALQQDFDFQSEGDKSRAVASIIAPALKMGGFLNYRVPADIAEADQSQAGKGYRQKLIAAIYNEELSVVANRKGGVGSLDESFSYQLLEGHPFIQFDNLRGKLDSQMLESFFTADGTFPCRTPYKRIMNVHGAHYFIFLTSNGLETTRDLANRSAIIRIRKHPQDYPFTKYPEGDLLAHVRANQAHYLGCVFSIIREWYKAGKPHSGETRHDFKEWVQVMDWIVQHFFGLAPLMDGHLEAQQLVSDPDMVFLRQVCNAVERGGALDEPQAAIEIATLCDAENIGIPGLRYSGDLHRCAQQVGSCLGRIFKTSDLVSVDDYRVERQLSSKKRKDEEGYFDAKTYVFTRANPTKSPQQGNAPKRQQAQSKTPVVERWGQRWPQGHCRQRRRNCFMTGLVTDGPCGLGRQRQERSSTPDSAARNSTNWLPRAELNPARFANPGR